MEPQGLRLLQVQRRRHRPHRQSKAINTGLIQFLYGEACDHKAMGNLGPRIYLFAETLQKIDTLHQSQYRGAEARHFHTQLPAPQL